MFWDFVHTYAMLSVNYFCKNVSRCLLLSYKDKIKNRKTVVEKSLIGGVLQGTNFGKEFVDWEVAIREKLKLGWIFLK